MIVYRRTLLCRADAQRDGGPGKRHSENTKGEIFPVNDFKLMRRAQYEKLGNPLAMTPDIERVPLQVYEARNAVDIAKSRGAEKDAPENFYQGLRQLANDGKRSNW